MTPTNSYEQFRDILASNLYKIVDDEQISKILQAVDMSLSGFDISRKPVELTVSTGIPEVVKYYLVSKAVANLSKSTLRQYKYKLINFFNTVRKAYMDINATDIRLYLLNYKTLHNSSDRYIESIRTVLSGMFTWLADNEYIVKNPCANVDKIKFQEVRREPLSTYELEVLRYFCKTQREKALIDFIYSTGCRVSECSDMNLSDINWNDRSALIRHGKGNKQRKVFFNAESQLSLQKYLETRTDEDEALFVQTYAPHTRLSARGIQNEIKKIGDRAHIKVYPHKLRHTFATVGISGGMPLERLQALLGHENPRTTLIYAKLDNTDLQREHRRIYA